jgi:site-specific DNA-cytosine methylase
MSELRHASFFSGVGGLDLGFENAGIRTVSLCEIEPYASAVLAERFPGVPNFGDITKINDEEVPDAEVYSGGFPCQDLSTAGNRRGFADGTRSSLAFRFLDIVERRRPRWFVLENVIGLFSSNHGRDFGRLIHEVESLGYGLAWRTLDARWFGVAQRRRRVFIVAARDDAFGGSGADRAAEVLIECEGVCGHLATGGATGEKTPPRARSRVDVGHAEHPTAHPDGMRTVDGMAGRLDDREPVVGSLTGGGSDSPQSERIFSDRGLAPTLDTGRAVPKVLATIQDARDINKAQNGVGLNDGELAYTLTRLDRQGVILANPGDKCPACERQLVESEPYQDWTGVDVDCSICWDTGTVRPYGSENVLSFPSRFGDAAMITENVAQSFAPSGGAPAVLRSDTVDVMDDDPLNPIGLDSNRYRCIGNGVVAPVAEFIGRRIVAVDAKYWKEANA